MINELEKYTLIREFCPQAYEFFVKNIQSLPLGRYELGNGIYANIECYESKLRRDGLYEAHQRFYDIQYIIEGEELITLAPLKQVEQRVLEPYDPQRDIIFYARDDGGIDHYLKDGDFIIIGPDTAHMPQICVNKQQTVKKCVVKVPV